jgi:hypothetical protein
MADVHSRRVFELYQNSGFINFPEFQRLIKDLMILNGKFDSVVLGEKVILYTKIFWDQIGKVELTLTRFQNAVNIGLPFDYQCLDDEYALHLQNTYWSFFKSSNHTVSV